MRIAIHDYAGHPFQMELSRALAARGHTIGHFFFADDPGPKGAAQLTSSDPKTLSIEPISLGFRLKRESLVQRLISDIAYALVAPRKIQAFRPDVVISGNTPLQAQAAIRRAAKAADAAFIFWVQDLYGVAVQRLLKSHWSGLGNLLGKYYTTSEASLLEGSDAIVAISPDFKQHLPKSARDSGNVHVVRNWGPIQEIGRRDKMNAWSEQHGLCDKFVFMYTGTLGRKHDPRLLWALADSFQDDPDVAVVVAATGASATQLRAWQAADPKANLHLLPVQPMHDFANVLGTADVLLTILEGDAGEFSVPSKMLSYFCAGRSVLLSAPAGNLATGILQESHGGVAIPSGNIEAFTNAARQMRHDHLARKTYSEAARAYAERNFDIDAIASRFEAVFEQAYWFSGAVKRSGTKHDAHVDVHTVTVKEFQT